MQVNLGPVSFQIDHDDWERLKHLPWRGAINGQGRMVVTRQTKTRGVVQNIYIQQDILTPFASGLWVDHINGDPCDHRRQNLRLCSPQQNSFNRRVRSDSKSGLKGVSKKKNRYVARIYVEGRHVRLGSFISADDAANAYDDAARRYFGEFARLNAVHGSMDSAERGCDHGAQ